MTANLDPPRRALAVGAHPDDIEIGCGGTLAKWAAQGCEIAHLVCTDGAKGTWDPDEDPALLVARRREEQRVAARVLGGHGEVHFLGWPDGELECGIRQRIEVAHVIRRVRPDVVLGHDPWKRYRLHPDHRSAGFLVTDAIVAARDPMFFRELDVAPHRPKTLLLWEADEVDHLEDISGFLDTKIDALLAHTSQLRSTMHVEPPADRSQPRADLVAFEERTRERHRELGAAWGIELAEAFKRVDDL